MLDGTYFNGWCVLIAYTGEKVIHWQWCDREKTASWTALIARIPAPRYAVVDGNGPLTTVIETLWPDTRIQRCFFHIRQAGHRHLTRNPSLPANQELLRLYQALPRVDSRDQAAAWLAAFASWEAKWSRFLKHRTRAKDAGARPAHVRRGQSWWYTHLRTRRAYFFLSRIIAKGHLFTWLDAADEGIELARTTNALEGGINAGIKGLLRAHRGLSEGHARRGVDWFLFERSHQAGTGWSLVGPEHWAPPKRVRAPREEPIGPVEYGTGFSWEDGIGIQKGWGGRRG